LPPKVNYFHLNLPDVATLTRARQVHQQGITGSGIKVVMIDSGFFNHPFYQANGFKVGVVLAPGALNPALDSNGHGTAQAGNLFATAPGIRFVMLKQGTNPVVALKQAIALAPDIIICSWCFDLVMPGPARAHQPSVPSTFKPLEMEIANAVAKGICVVCAAGNGQVAFPGMHPDVICVGGVFVTPDLNLIASDLASAFSSRPYPGRHVPDVCGLVGMKPAGIYIMLPLQPGSNLDKSLAVGPFPNGDSTTPTDGWIATSGTSAAAPQVAGVCALLKQKNPSLSPQQLKQALIAGASDCSSGAANPESNQGVALGAGAGPDGATGHGFVNAAASVALV
jgi:subtilisin family serine protease